VPEFDVTADEFELGGRRVRIWRPAQPQYVDDPDAERGAAGPVWAQLWTSGIVLAGIVAHQRLHDARVLELGCGLGFAGLAAAVAGARVTVSDRSRYALAFAAANAQDNGFSVQTVRCDWRDAAPLAAAGPWDLVLGSDVLYDTRSAYHLLALLGRVTDPAGEIWLADPGRDPAQAFAAAASGDWRLSRRSCGHGIRLYRLRRFEGERGTRLAGRLDTTSAQSG
jgi:predicted nicotinamide N-methyase